MAAMENLYILDGNDFSLCEKLILLFHVKKKNHIRQKLLHICEHKRYFSILFL